MSKIYVTQEKPNSISTLVGSQNPRRDPKEDELPKSRTLKIVEFEDARNSRSDSSFLKDSLNRNGQALISFYKSSGLLN